MKILVTKQKRILSQQSCCFELTLSELITFLIGSFYVLSFLARSENLSLRTELGCLQSAHTPVNDYLVGPLSKMESASVVHFERERTCKHRLLGVH